MMKAGNGLTRGGASLDRFAFRVGRNRIADFALSDDRIDLRGRAVIDRWSARLRQDGSHRLLRVGTLCGAWSTVARNALEADDFLF